MTGLVDRLAERRAKATPGPWRTEFSPSSEGIPAGWHLKSDSVETLADFGDATSAKLDAEYVAAMDNALPTLLAIARAAQAYVYGGDGAFAAARWSALQAALASLGDTE